MHTVIIRNTADDRTKVMQHRNAARFDPEPSIGGHRLRLGQEMEVEYSHYTDMEDYLAPMVVNGMIELLQCKTVEGTSDPVDLAVPRPKRDYSLPLQEASPPPSELPPPAPDANLSGQAPAPSEEPIPELPPVVPPMDDELTPTPEGIVPPESLLDAPDVAPEQAVEMAPVEEVPAPAPAPVIEHKHKIGKSKKPLY